MVIFPVSYSDCVDILLPCQCTVSQPIAFGLLVPNVSSKITCSRTHPKSVTCPEQLSRLKIIWAYDQYALGRLRLIPHPRLWCVRESKQVSSLANIPNALALSSYEGYVTSGTSYLRFLISVNILILYVIITRGQPCVTPSLLCIILDVPLPFYITSDAQ